MRLRLSRLVGGNSPALAESASSSDLVRNEKGYVVLEFPNVEAATHWKNERQIEMKWNLDRGRDSNSNKARTEKNAGA